MRWIEKGSAPACLAERRREALRVERASGKEPQATDWEPGNCAPGIRASLHRDQRGLCGYCMQRIGRDGCLDLQADHEDGRVSNRGMRIEHIVAREAEPRRMYDWDNLLGVCCGRSTGPGQAVFDHCDRTRGSTALRLDPTRRAPDPELVLSYQRCGETGGLLVVAGAPYDADVETLNLNHPVLARRRRVAEDAIAAELARCQKRGVSRSHALKRLLAVATTPDARGELPEFAPVAARYIERKMKQ